MAEPAYAARIAQLHARLGIPTDYAAARNLTLQPEAIELVRAGITGDGHEILLVEPAAAAWERMRNTAASDGHSLLPLSGFRTVVRQEEIFRKKIAAGLSPADILRVVAAPGYSEHHTGRALDLGAPGEPPLEESFAATAAFHWLALHAGQFGFRLSYPRGNPQGIAYEPWHWCWHP